jgi:hypothetical protein
VNQYRRDRYNVFHRTWWKVTSDPNWPNGLEPCIGEKYYIAHDVSRRHALALCKQYNRTHSPGRLSDKAEFEDA